MKKIVYLVSALILLFSTLAMANRYLIREQAKEYDRKMCVAVHANFCINQLCMTSTERDCQPQCRKLARSKCQYEDEYDNSYRRDILSTE